MPSNKRKQELLRMHHATASGRLRKLIMYDLVVALGRHICYRCKQPILSAETLSIEHKVAWQTSPTPIDTFFDLSNIAFSHHSCNSGATHPRPIVHGSYNGKKNCECDKCIAAFRAYHKAWQRKRRADQREQRPG